MSAAAADKSLSCNRYTPFPVTHLAFAHLSLSIATLIRCHLKWRQSFCQPRPRVLFAAPAVRCNEATKQKAACLAVPPPADSPSPIPPHFVNMATVFQTLLLFAVFHFAFAFHLHTVFTISFLAFSVLFVCSIFVVVFFLVFYIVFYTVFAVVSLHIKLHLFSSALFLSFCACRSYALIRCRVDYQFSIFRAFPLPLFKFRLSLNASSRAPSP